MHHDSPWRQRNDDRSFEGIHRRGHRNDVGHLAQQPSQTEFSGNAIVLGRELRLFGFLVLMKIIVTDNVLFLTTRRLYMDVPESSRTERTFSEWERLVSPASDPDHIIPPSGSHRILHQHRFTEPSKPFSPHTPVARLFAACMRPSASSNGKTYYGSADRAFSVHSCA